MKMQSDDVREFWREKERETNSRFVTASFATYLKGYQGETGPVTGVLYLMENGFYFENFESHSALSFLFSKAAGSLKKSSFKKLYIKIPCADIQGLSYFGLPQSTESITGKIVNLFRARSWGIVITWRSEQNRTNSVHFECMEKPEKIGEHYNKLVES